MTTTEQVSRNVLIVRFDGISSGWRQLVMLSGDRHHDNILCRRELEKQHLEKARAEDALVLDCGDLFCAMQGKYDPRASMDNIRAEDVGDDYLDRIVRHAAEFYSPYADMFVMIGRGNHESAIRKHHGTDLISNLVHRLNTEHGGHIFTGEYGGWVIFRFQYHSTVQTSRLLKYHHGAGGGGPVTRGVIQTNRQSVYTPDAHVVLNGHTHDAWHVPIARERISQKGVVHQDIVHFVRTPGYKDDYNDGARGFQVERWGPPKPLGCAWLEFSLHGDDIETKVWVDVV